jgi:acetolactate synthase-1/2/3 large subunit
MRLNVIKRCFFTTTNTYKPNKPIHKNTFVGMSGGQIFHEMMLRHNVNVVFGYPGGAILPVYDAIYNSNYFKFILSRHEQGAGHMAQGYARATGKPGIILVTSGPGATNIITPLHDAFSDGTPIIVFSGQVPTTAIGTDAFQEADIIGISRFCTKWNVMVKDIQDLPRCINEAFEIATSGRPGPVLVDLPKNVTAGILKKSILDNFYPNIPGKNLITSSKPSSLKSIQKTADLLNIAQKPILYVGQGMLMNPDGNHVLKELANKSNIPVTTTLQGLGSFDEDDPKSLHMLGMHGSAYANLAMQSADLIIALGARFDDRVTGNLKHFASNAKRASLEKRGGIIHFEIMPKNINKIVQVDEAIEGDVTTNVKHLIPLVEYKKRSNWFNELNTWKKKYPFQYFPCLPGQPIKPQSVIEELNKQTNHIKENVIISTGVGCHQMWAAQYYRWKYPRTWISSGGLGTMGFGLPAAIGAKIACPEKIVIDIDGDASFSMTGMELMTARQYDIGVKVLILNNNFQGMVKQWQDLFYDKRYSATKMHNPDFVKLAESMGIKGIKVTDIKDLSHSMTEFLETNEPVLLEVLVEKNEHVYPMVPAGKALHDMELGSIKLEESISTFN